MTELSHLAPLYCPVCGEIVEIDGEEGGTLYYYCDECDEAVDPVSKPPTDPTD